METEYSSASAQERSLDHVKDIPELIKHCEMKEYWEWKCGARSHSESNIIHALAESMGHIVF
jgi:hypothetical protein